MPNKQALVVGINNYTTAPVLSYATHDATEVASALQLPEYSFDTSVLLDGDATVVNLKASLATLCRSSADTKLFFFAGHGYANDKGVYLVTADDSEDGPGISLDWLRGQVLAARNTVILILDCCHSGAASVRNNPAHRWMSEADVDRSIGSLGSGKILLAACASDKMAVELPEAAHGIFTFHLLEGLTGQASNLRGTIS